jgi:diguanylate cyclase (GGDEF)-like protein
MMNIPAYMQRDSTGPSLQEQLISGLDWLVYTPRYAFEKERRRAHLLAWLLLSLLLLSMAALCLVLLIDYADPSYRTIYFTLISGLIVLLAFAYALNRAGHFFPAAGLTVACAMMGPWGSMMLDPHVLRGDFVPLTFVAVTILLSSILLPPLVTIALAALQILILAFVPLFHPAATDFINWPSLVSMIFFSAVLSIVASLVTQRDMALIDSQTRQLTHTNRLINGLAHVTRRLEGALTQAEVMEALGEELRAINLLCMVVTYCTVRKSFKVSFTSMEPDVLEQIEAGLGFPFIERMISHDRLGAVLSMEKTPDVEIHPLFDRPREMSSSAVLSAMEFEDDTLLLRLPLTFETKVLGVLWICGKGIRATDSPIFAAFAKQVATSLDRARLFQEVQSLALTDSLTGLQNRRGLFELGRIEFARAQRLERPFCCMILDVDHFKQINDSYGHLAGDEVLQEFARRCRVSIRGVDLIGRYGGEELVILLPETTIEAAVPVAERLRAEVEKTPIIVSGRELHITVSIGVSMKDEHTMALETLIARADQALYIAKHKGRNRVATSK